MEDVPAQEPKVRIKVDQDSKGLFKIEATARGETAHDTASLVLEIITETRAAFDKAGVKYLVPSEPKPDAEAKK